MTKTYLYGYNGGRKTLAQMDADPSWNKLHPEFRRRLGAMMDACPHDLGFGGGWRSDASQNALHEAQPYLSPTAKSSYHCSTDPFGYALAADLLNYDPAIRWANENCGRFWLYDLSGYRSERWHFQPKEIPRSRSNYRSAVHTIQYWPNGSGTVFTCPWPNVSMKQGSSGEAVARMQTQLKAWLGFYSAAIDGQYGPKTVAAVKLAQAELIRTGRDPGPVDGQFGPRTRAAACSYYESKGWSL